MCFLLFIFSAFSDKPVIRDGKLWGRGSIDDGYALFTAITAVKNMQHQNMQHARYVVIIEFGEESGSPDLPVSFKYVANFIQYLFLFYALVCLFDLLVYCCCSFT